MYLIYIRQLGKPNRILYIKASKSDKVSLDIFLNDEWEGILYYEPLTKIYEIHKFSPNEFKENITD